MVNESIKILKGKINLCEELKCWGAEISYESLKVILNCVTQQQKEIDRLNEKEKPKMPIPVKDDLMGRLVSTTCPNCNPKDLGNNEHRFNRCEECGQALDWSEYK